MMVRMAVEALAFDLEGGVGDAELALHGLAEDDAPMAQMCRSCTSLTPGWAPR
jgi:hypothetical protein